MSYRLYFNPREWSFNKDCKNNVGERCFINGLEDDELVEVYTIGNWNYDWTEIVSKPITLEKQSKYCISFWLNGGENDKNDEICQFRVVYNDDHENALVYKLNRSFIKPLKRYKGWELYNISFNSFDYESAQLRFVAMSAYMTIMPANKPEYYEDWEDIIDPYDKLRPQRHNLVFEDGWPTNTWYSTNQLKKKGSRENNNDWSQAKEWGKQMAKDIKGRMTEFHMPEIHIPEIRIPDITFPNKNRNKSQVPPTEESMGESQEKEFEEFYDDSNTTDDCESNYSNDNSDYESAHSDTEGTKNSRVEFVDDILDQIKEAIQVDKIVDEIKNSIPVDEMAEQIKNSFKTSGEYNNKNSIDPEKLANEIKESILSHFKSESK